MSAASLFVVAFGVYLNVRVLVSFDEFFGADIADTQLVRKTHKAVMCLGVHVQLLFCI